MYNADLKAGDQVMIPGVIEMYLDNTDLRYRISIAGPASCPTTIWHSGKDLVLRYPAAPPDDPGSGFGAPGPYDFQVGDLVRVVDAIGDLKNGEIKTVHAVDGNGSNVILEGAVHIFYSARRFRLERRPDSLGKSVFEPTRAWLPVFKVGDRVRTKDIFEEPLICGVIAWGPSKVADDDDVYLITDETGAPHLFYGHALDLVPPERWVPCRGVHRSRGSHSVWRDMERLDSEGQTQEAVVERLECFERERVEWI